MLWPFQVMASKGPGGVSERSKRLPALVSFQDAAPTVCRASDVTCPAGAASSPAGLNEWPVSNPSLNQPIASTPTANSVSPGTRSQRNVCIVGVCRNSALRAYHVPSFTAAHVCIKPTGSRLIVTISSSPTLMHQKLTFSAPVFHSRPGIRPRTQNSISPRPNMP